MAELNPTDWHLRGDTNYTTYGGLLIRQDPDYLDRSYNVIEVLTSWDTDALDDEHVWAWYYTVDLDDTWMDVPAALDCCGLSLDDDPTDFDIVESVIRYYSHQEFNPEGLADDRGDTLTIDELREALVKLGAEDFA